MSSVSARYISEKLEYQGGTFTWEDNSDCSYSAYNRYLFSGFGLGKTVKIGEMGYERLYLGEFDGWFKDHYSANARFYSVLGWLETPWTDRHIVNKCDNVTIKTNSKSCKPWIEYYING
jgi:hypothetical protein